MASGGCLLGRVMVDLAGRLRRDLIRIDFHLGRLGVFIIVSHCGGWKFNALINWACGLEGGG